MLKQSASSHSQQQQTSLMSNDQETIYNVFELANSGQNQTSIVLKLTDECSAAISNAIKSKRVIRLHVQKEVAVIEVANTAGDPINFKCSLQNQPATDSIAFDQRKQLFMNIGTTTNSRFQVQATDKSFTEMKEKTQKLVEQEQQRKAKDMPKTQKSTKMPTHAHKSYERPSFVTKFATASNKRPHSPSPRPSVLPVVAKQSKMEESSKQAKSSLLSTKASRMVEEAVRIKMEPRPLDSMEPVSTNTQQYLSAGQVEPKKDLFYIPKRKTAQRAPSISPASTTTSTPKTISPPFPVVRPHSVDSSLQHSSSCSPDEFPFEQGSMTLPLKQSRDWSQVFAKIKNAEDAKRYYTLFKTEYPEYRQCYEDMVKVATEFRELETAYKETENENERLRVEKLIRGKFANYQSDSEFLRKRQRHQDLRAKLEIVKQKLTEWTSST